MASALALVVALAMAAWLVSLGIPNPAFSGTTNGAELPSPTAPAYDIFLKIDGIPGESVDKAHEAWIEVLSFNQGMEQPMTHMGGTEYREVEILKVIDKASPKLYEALNKGEAIASLEIDIVDPDNRTAVMKVVLEGVMVTSIETGLAIFKEWGTASPIIYKAIDSSSPQIAKASPMLAKPLAFGHDARHMEQVSFSFRKIQWTYTYTDAGGQSQTVSSGWDLVQNKPA